MEPGIYIVSTPIGNLDDITLRAIETLKHVSVIAAEDTRHSRRLLDHLGISTALTSLHEHNERGKASVLIDRVHAGESIALISDAGTPLISDPGYHLVRAAREQGVRVVPVPGVCALITGLSVAGLATDRFVFEGFLPAKRVGRMRIFERLRAESGTMVFYESPHRIKEFMEDAAIVFGADRMAVFARELTKRFETVAGGSLAELNALIAGDGNQSKGEFVVMIEGAAELSGEDAVAIDADVLLLRLLQELPIKKVAAVAADIFKGSKKDMYERALLLQGRK
ncbi:MAG: 16S rRNA (cytidine(1402)-2'-O)-methyltransferase [Hahellaceae bacterium]|nr:16S rRNA (cytidine(1402)-2'-O)-methyltransferase [Hahellaceae bacterium]MCP5210793.1 16S rRNA (cytidine(1402)-2'-O)-methyltransferase [Hahellaceae bacterium]